MGGRLAEWRIWLRGLVLGVALTGLVGPSTAQDDSPLKAAIVFNLLMYVQWPGEADLPAGTPLRLCGDRASTLWPHLRSLRDRPLRQFRLELRELANGEVPRDCQILLLDASARRGAGRAGAGLLTMSHDERADDGEVVLGLHMAGGRVVFDVDLGTARRNGLLVSSKLLRLARAVRE